jgi:DNA-binding transcriptional ArsR family regulator
MYAVLRMPGSHVHAEHRRQEPVEDDVVAAIAQTMQALATASRVQLLYALHHGEHTVGELAAACRLAPAAVSQQLRILRHLRLVVSRREGQAMHYRLHDDHVGVLLEEIRNHVEHANRGWSVPEALVARNRGPGRQTDALPN